MELTGFPILAWTKWENNIPRQEGRGSAERHCWQNYHKDTNSTQAADHPTARCYMQVPQVIRFPKESSEEAVNLLYPQEEIHSVGK